MKNAILFLATMLVLFTGCNKYDDDIADIEDRLEQIEGASLTAINQQIIHINGSLETLKAVDAELKGYIGNLENAAGDLQRQIDDVNTALAALESDLKGQITASEQKVLSELNTVKTALEGQLATINNTIATLQAKDAKLDQKIADLKTYVDSGITATKDWATATFSTLEQYEATQTALSEINALIKSTQESITALEEKLGKKIADDIAAAVAGVNSDIAAKVIEITNAYTTAIANATDAITAAYTDAIKTAITASETSMKEWVNGVLADGYYNKAEIDGKITALQTKVAEGDAALQKEIDALKEALAKAESDLTAAYKKVIADAITENNGKISAEIAAAVKTAQDNLQAQIDTINGEIEKIKARLDIIEADINSINQQIDAINGSIDDLKRVDGELKGYIESLERTAEGLQNQLDATNEKIDNVKKEMGDEIDAAEQNLLNELNKLKTDIEGEIANIKADIEHLKAKDLELDQKIADLQTYVDNELASYATADWANATFATLQMYLETQQTIADLEAANIEAIKEAVDDLKTDMIDWVNGELEQPLKDIAALQSDLNALISDVATDEELATAVAAQEKALKKAIDNLTAAYKKAIEDAVANGGVIDKAIAAAVKAAQDALLVEINGIRERIDALEAKINDIAGRIQSLTFVPQYSDGKVEMDYTARTTTLDFIVSPAALAQTIKTAFDRDNSTIKAFVRYTEDPTTRATSGDPVQQIVNSMNVVGSDGMFTLTIGQQGLSDDFWQGKVEAVIYIHISTGSSNFVSEAIPMIAHNYAGNTNSIGGFGDNDNDSYTGNAS